MRWVLQNQVTAAAPPRKAKESAHGLGQAPVFQRAFHPEPDCKIGRLNMIKSLGLPPISGLPP